MIRVKLVSASRLLALGAFVAVATALVVYLVVHNRRVEGDPTRPKLQGKVVAIFYNTRYAHEVAGHVRFVLTSGVDKTYEDGTHELEQVRLESYGTEGARRDVVTSDSAKVSDPSNLSKLDAEFVGNVVVQTSDGAQLKTVYLHYDQPNNIVDTKEYVEFEGRGFSGHSTGMIVEANDERVQLQQDVELTIKPDSKEAGKQSTDNKIAQSNKQSVESAEEKAARKARKRARKRERQREAELASSGGPSANRGDKSKGKSGRASNQDELVSKEPTNIHSNSALLEKQLHRVTLTGNVVVTQGRDEMRADQMVSFFNAENQVERLEARGNSYLKQTDKAEVKARDMDFFFGEDRRISHALATGGAETHSLGPAQSREARADKMEILFAGGLVETTTATGNAVIQVHAPAPADQRANPAERTLSADQVTSEFHEDGKFIKQAQATGNAVLVVTPVRAQAPADKKTIRAPEMNGTFFDEGNHMKSFTASGGVRIDIEAMVANQHPPRVVTSQTATADFIQDSQDVERLRMDGDVKYNEGDRNGVAERAFYDGPQEILNLRGKRPMVWDQKARTQADEIDYDRKQDQTHARGDVRTTYYSRETTNDATPFKNSKSPIFITAERGDARNSEGLAVYTGNARGWQDDNFVRGDRIELYEKEKRMAASGNVESALYQVKRESAPDKRETVPGFATAERMTYSDIDRVVHYEGGVKARQGTDRIEASKVDVILEKETNDVDRMNAEGNVVFTQPGRRGTGDHLAYTSVDGRAVLTGKTARIEDREKGATMGTELTFYNRDDKISVENQQGTGRVRSTHRLTKNK